MSGCQCQGDPGGKKVVGNQATCVEKKDRFCCVNEPLGDNVTFLGAWQLSSQQNIIFVLNSFFVQTEPRCDVEIESG